MTPTDEPIYMYTIDQAEDDGILVGEVVDREHHRPAVEDEPEPAHVGVVLE